MTVCGVQWDVTLLVSTRSFAVVLLLSAISTFSGYNVQAGTTMTLDCIYRMEQHAWGSQYTCVAQRAVVTSFETYVTEAKGEHIEGKTNDDVQAIYFVNQTTRYVPLDLAKPFPNIIALRMQKSGLKFINQTTFKKQRMFRFIQLDDNEIEFIPKKTFWGQRNLESLSISGNRIKRIDSDMLLGLRNLKYFYANGNSIAVIGSSLFRDNTNLEEIFFANNKIRMIGPQLVSRIKELKFARFDGNLCTVINLHQPTTNIVDTLTTEFTQKCAVNCDKAFNAAFNEVEDLMNQSEMLRKASFTIKMEKETLTYECNRD